MEVTCVMEEACFSVFTVKQNQDYEIDPNAFNLRNYFL